MAKTTTVTKPAGQETKHSKFAAPDEVRDFPKGRADILKVGTTEVGRLTFEPGWRWSKDVKSIAGTESCEAPHFQYHVSGRLAIRMDDGTEFVAGPGDVTSLPKGHDAWVVGKEPVVVVDWYGASHYALPSPKAEEPAEDDHAASLQAAAADLRALADATPQCMYIYLDESNKWCNARFAKLLGYATTEAWARVNDSFTDAFVDPKSQRTLVATYQDAIKRGVGAQIDVAWRGKNGKPVPSKVILVPIERQGHRMALHFITPT